MRATDFPRATASTSSAIAAGAVGGVYGGAAMSLLRLGMHRAGLIDKMVPQAVEEWVSDRLAAEPPGGAAGHHVLDQLLHLGYGAGWGALAGPLLLGRDGRAGLWRGAAFGAAVWGIGMLALLPGLRIARPAWKAGMLENAVNLGAHVLYGVGVQLLVEEPRRQRARRRTSDAERRAARVA